MLLATPEQKVVVTYFAVTGVFRPFCAQKGHGERLQKGINDKSLKGKYCGGIQGQADPAPTV